MDFTPSGTDLITAAFTAALMAIGWMVNSQTKTNKTLSQAIADAVIEFKLAMASVHERDETQKMACKIHRTQTTDLKRQVDGEIRKLKQDIETIKKDKK